MIAKTDMRKFLYFAKQWAESPKHRVGSRICPF